MRRTAAAALIPLILATSACARPDTGSPVGAPPAQSPSVQGGSLPPGWRWESYGGVEVGVPGEWGWGNGAQRLFQWCVGRTDRDRKPIVGRPGSVTLVGCPGGKPDPATLIANTGSVVAFDRTTEPSGVLKEGDQTAVRLDGVQVTVNAPAELRRRIVGTIRRAAADVDSYGCPTTHAISTNPQQRPAEPLDVTSLEGVSTVSACKFRVGQDSDAAEPRLISSLRLDGSAAEQAVRGIAKAPLGGGPDNPDQCLPSVSYGDDIIVLLVTSAARRSEIVLRYSGCGHNGFDDGIAVRALTAEAVAPFVTRSNTTLYGFSGGPEKLAILVPGPANR